MPIRSARPRAVRVAGLLVVTAAAAAVAACGGGSSEPVAKASSTPVSATATNVTIDTFMFMPNALHVHVGDTVVWTNNDNILHTVTSGTREYDPGDSGRVTATHKSGTFDAPLDGKGATTRVTFTSAGTFHYFCDRHPGMEADVDVAP